MPLIDFYNIISSLSNESFCELITLTESYLPIYFIKKDMIDKNIYIEKVGEYLKQFEINTKVKDNDFAAVFCNELYSLLKYRSLLSSSAEKYELRAKYIADNINSYDNIELIQKLEDISKIFICFYNAVLENGVPVKDVSFFSTEVNFEKIHKNFLDDKQEYGKDLKAFLNKAGQIVPDSVKDAASKVQDGVEKINEKFSKRPDEIYEPVHNVIENDAMNDPYTKRNFAYILLCFFYLRLLDFENGRGE